MTEHTMKPTLGILEAAELLKVHPRTVGDLIQSGAIPAAKVGRAWVMMTADVLNYLDGEISRQTAKRMRAPLLRTPHNKGQAKPWAR